MRKVESETILDASSRMKIPNLITTHNLIDLKILFSNQLWTYATRLERQDESRGEIRVTWGTKSLQNPWWFLPTCTGTTARSTLRWDQIGLKFLFSNRMGSYDNILKGFWNRFGELREILITTIYTRTTLILLSLCQSGDKIAHPGSSKLSEILIFQPHGILWQHIKRILKSVRWASRNSDYNHLYTRMTVFKNLSLGLRLESAPFGERATPYS